MARTNIELPEKFKFSIEHRVMISEINASMHFGADRILPIIVDAQVQFFIHLGYSDFRSIDGENYIMVDSEIMYLSEIFYGDTLIIEVTAGNFGKYNFEVLYKVSKKSTGEEAARVKTGMLFYNYKEKSPAAVPINFKNKFISNTQS
jgi:4-hydroxybenzoyl-CoA thioesterase